MGVYRHAPAIALLCLMGWFLTAGALRDSPTVDEGHHLVRGLAFWWGKDARLSTPHPPLANLLQALPTVLSAPPFDVTKVEGWEGDWKFGNVARAYLRADYPSARRALLAGRFVTAALTLLLGLYVYARLLPHGLALARSALFLFVFHPLFLSHGRLVTTDMAITVASALLVGETLRYLRTKALLSVLTLGLVLGAALATKFSGLFLVPALVVSLGAAALRGCERYSPARLSGRLALVSRDLLVVGLLACLVVNAAYRFQRTGWSVGEILAYPEPASGFAERGTVLAKHSPLPLLPSWLPIPLPYPYVFGLSTIRAQDEKGHGGWFWGEKSKEGSRLYFPVLAAIKTPASITLLLLLAFALMVGRVREKIRSLLPPGVPWLMPTLVPAIYLAIAIPSKIQIGVRHILPVMLFLMLAAAWAAAELWEGRAGLRRRWSRLLVVGLSALLALEVAASHPRYLSHFNWLIGGGSVGHRISMIGEDWGQDVVDLARLVKEEELLPLYYKPYGGGPAVHELSFHGVEFRRFSCKREVKGPAWVAVHAAQALRQPRRCGPIRSLEPDRIVNDHVWLYRVE